MIPLKTLFTRLSALAAVLLTIFAIIEPHVDKIHSALPESWAAGFGVLIFVLRAIKQSSSGPSPPGDDKPGSPPASSSPSRTRGGLASFLVVPVLLLGCSEAKRPPERDPCYLAADAEAARRYLTECKGHKDTRSCPAGDKIEAAHQAAQEACK